MDRERLYQLESDLCRVLTHRARLQILEELRDGEKTPSALAAGFKTTQANISTHLSVLRQAGVIAARREGQKIHYRVIYPEIYEAFDIMRGVLMAVLSKQGSIYKEMKSAYK